jgi:hypothetical protein
MHGRHTFVAANLRCDAVSDADYWVVRVLAVSVARDRNLATAIELATGGIVGSAQAKRIAERIIRLSSTESGSTKP